MKRVVAQHEDTAQDPVKRVSRDGMVFLFHFIALFRLRVPVTNGTYHNSPTFIGLIGM
jgi:hypothetical protein